MICQDAPRKSLNGCHIPKEKGFWVDGKDLNDCFKQLKEWGEKHPEKWIYYYDCGIAPGSPVPVARHLLEISIYDAKPAALLFSRCFQEGKDGKREIDMMTEEQRSELASKQLLFFAMLGSQFGK